MANANDLQFKFSLDEINFILEKLGECKYIEVHTLIAKIHNQAQEQVSVKKSPVVKDDEEYIEEEYNVGE